MVGSGWQTLHRRAWLHSDVGTGRSKVCSYVSTRPFLDEDFGGWSFYSEEFRVLDPRRARLPWELIKGQEVLVMLRETEPNQSTLRLLDITPASIEVIRCTRCAAAPSISYAFLDPINLIRRSSRNPSNTTSHRYPFPSGLFRFGDELPRTLLPFAWRVNLAVKFGGPSWARV